MLDYFTILEKYIGAICKNCKINSGSDIFTTIHWMPLKEYIYVCLQHLNYRSQLFHKRNWRCCLLHVYPGLEKSTDLKIGRYRTFTIENHNSRSRWLDGNRAKKNSREAHKQSLHCLSMLENAGNLLRGSIFHSNLHFKRKVLLFLDNEGKALLHIHFMPNKDIIDSNAYIWSLFICLYHKNIN